MGMDVIGRNPKSAAGKYFRNNVWWWHPLWSYCCEVAPQVCDDVSGHTNDGDGLPADGAARLARVLAEELVSGRTKDFELRHTEELASLPMHTCEYCAGSGVRNDSVGVDQGMPERRLTEVRERAVGRTHGWCNGCDGSGSVSDHRTSYPFSTENVAEFQRFLADCGGFTIC